MNLTSLLEITQENSGEQPHNLNARIANSLIFIVENYFLQLAPSFVLTLSYRGVHFSKFYNNLLEKLFKGWEAPPMQVVKISPNCVRYVSGSRDLNLILIDSYESFRAVDVISYTSDYNRNEFYHIFLQNWDEMLDMEMTKIFNYCWDNYMINCNVQIQTRHGEILIYTYYPFSPEKCGEITIKLINEFKNNKLSNKILFPRKLLNFHGCPLRGAMWNIPPFVHMVEFGNGSGLFKNGIEVRMVKLLAEKLNFTVVVKVPPNNEQRGEVREGNLTGAFLMLKERAADFSVGCFRFALDRLQIATPTLTYYQSSVIVVIPRKAYVLSSLEMLLFPFTRATWFLLSGIWIVVALLMWLTNKHQRSHAPYLFDRLSSNYYLNVLLMAIGMPSLSMPFRFSTRLLCINWIAFSLLIRTIYQALLFHILRTHPTNRLPITIFDLVEENYTIVMNNPTYQALKDIKSLIDLDFYVVDSLDETIPFEYIEKNPQRNLVATGGLDFIIHYYTENRKDGVFQLLKENIFSMPLTMFLSKHSYLLNQFNEELMQFFSNGFIQAWTKWELDYDYLRNHYVENDIVGIKHLHMVFDLTILGMILATIVFLLEILSKKFVILQKFF